MKRPTPEEREAKRLLEVAARQYHSACGGVIEVDELRSMGSLAAALAVQNWDGRGNFGDFALQRIRWGILDEVRKRARQMRLSDSRDEVSALVATERAADAAEATELPGFEGPLPSVDSLLSDAVSGYALEVEAEDLPGEGPEHVEHDVLRLRLRKAVETLPMVQRAVTERYLYHLDTFQEIGEALGITAASAFDAYNRAVRRLRRLLNPDEEKV